MQYDNLVHRRLALLSVRYRDQYDYLGIRRNVTWIGEVIGYRSGVKSFERTFGRGADDGRPGVKDSPVSGRPRLRLAVRG
jgi:hypothetical protein